MPALRSQPVDEKYQTVEGAGIFYDPELEEALRPYALRFKQMAVHEVSRIKTVLKEVESLQLDTDWHREVEFAMYKGDQQGFDRLVNSVIKQTEDPSS